LAVAHLYGCNQLIGTLTQVFIAKFAAHKSHARNP
jgi:hypothetical protein